MGTTGSTPLSGAVSIGSGRDMGNVTLADGRVMAWGHNLYGQLGDGTTTNRPRAVDDAQLRSATATWALLKGPRSIRSTWSMWQAASAQPSSTTASRSRSSSIGARANASSSSRRRKATAP